MQTIEVSKNIEEVIEGIDTSVNCIKSTMGGKGKNVLFLDNNNIEFSQDGVSVANFYYPKGNGYHLIGANIVKDACNQTVKQVGDGTTCTAVMLQGFINKWVSDKPEDINEYLSDLESTIDLISSEIIDNSYKIKKDSKSKTRLKQIATVSSGSDKAGKLIYDIYKSVGIECNINLEKSNNALESYYEIEKGLQFHGGYLLNTCVNTEDDKCILENVNVVIESKKVNLNNYQQLLGDAVQNDNNYLFIAQEYDQNFIKMIMQNNITNVVLVKSPGYGDQIQDNYKDIIAYCNEDMTVDKLVVTTHTFNLQVETKTNAYKARRKKLKTLSETAEEEYDRVKYLERYYTLSGLIVNVYVGGTTPAERDELFYRLEDAVEACKSTINNGYIIGGGWELYKYKEVLDICELPAMTILENANCKIDTSIKGKHLNVKTMRYEDFLETGIIDPSLVPIASIKNAFSSFKLLVNTKYIIINGKE